MRPPSSEPNAGAAAAAAGAAAAGAEALTAAPLRAMKGTGAAATGFFRASPLMILSMWSMSGSVHEFFSLIFYGDGWERQWSFRCAIMLGLTGAADWTHIFGRHLHNCLIQVRESQALHRRTR
jgi:hypothetical protein